MAGVGLLAALGGVASGCRGAVTQPNTAVGVTHAPQVIIDPAQDTTVDSLGILEIAVAVHDPAYIDSVAVDFQGTAPPYYTFHPNDTVFQAVIPVGLGPLKHTTWSYSVTAANILGVDTTTSSVNVRVQ